MLWPGRTREPVGHRRGDPPLSDAGKARGPADTGEARRARIEAKLRERLAATYVSVEDESHLHAGHAGAQSGAGHFAAEIASERFRGLTRLAAQRLVYEALEDEMPRAIHALRIKTKLPEAAD